jgi:hypothetical protein
MRRVAMADISGTYGFYTKDGYQTLYLAVAPDGTFANSSLGDQPIQGGYDAGTGQINFTQPLDPGDPVLSVNYNGFVVQIDAVADFGTLAGMWERRVLGGGPPLQGSWYADTRQTIL